MVQVGQEVERAVVAFLERRLADSGRAGSLGRDVAVFDEGLLDSLSLLELVAAVEAATGQAVDMLRFDPAAVVSLDDLIAELSAACGG
jgi:acyl carrier protein